MSVVDGVRIVRGLVRPFVAITVTAVTCGLEVYSVVVQGHAISDNWWVTMVALVSFLVGARTGEQEAKKP